MLTGYRFRPGWMTTLATAVLLPALIGLGVWQLDRAEQKTEIRDRYAARGRMPPVDVNGQALDPEKMDFRQATVRGRYRAGLTIYLDNKVLDGEPGYAILTPLEKIPEADGGRRYILVNRGWVPWGPSRQVLPDIDTPFGMLEASGRLRMPAQDYFTLEDETGSGFRRRWQNLDLERYERVTGIALSPLVLELDPDARQAGGFVRRWPQYDDTWIDRHKAYAVQWFALALTLLVLYVALNLTKRKPQHE